MSQIDKNNFLKIFLQNSSDAILKLNSQLSTVHKISECISESIIKGNKVLACGNGGSAADAQHFAAEMLIRFRSDNDRKSLPAISLTQDVSTLTACANDYCFEEIYSRLICGLGRPGDILLAISTSGKSENILRAIKKAKQNNLKIILLTGKNITEMSKLSDFTISVEDNNTAIIQQAHITLIHSIMYLVEEILNEKSFL